MDESSRLGRILIFQQDNAKPHTAPALKAYLENWGYEVLNWPPQSPDLSPIENIWNVMKMKLKARRPRPPTIATMRDAMMKIWDDLSEDMRKKLVGTFRGRLKECIKNKGGLVRF
jgi:transposase